MLELELFKECMQRRVPSLCGFIYHKFVIDWATRYWITNSSFLNDFTSILCFFME